MTSASDAPTRVSAVAVRSCSCTSPGCRVEAEVSSPRPYDGPLATTARGRTGEHTVPHAGHDDVGAGIHGPHLRDQRVEPLEGGRALRPGLGQHAPVDEDDRAAERRRAARRRRSSPTPLGSAPPIAAPGPTVSTHAPDAVTPSPSVPGWASYEPAAAAARYSSQRGTRSPTTGSGSRHGPATSAARRPADTVSQPSTAHDRLRTARTVIDPTAPSRGHGPHAPAGRHPRRRTTTAPAHRRRPAAATPRHPPRSHRPRAPRRAGRAGRARLRASVAPAPHPCTSSCRAMTTRAAVHASGATAAGRPS